MTTLVVIAALVIAYFIVTYNGLVRKRQLNEEGWSGIDVQLKRRANLVPNMVETVQGYMQHERETLDAVVAARSAAQGAEGGNVQQRGESESLLSGALGRLFAVAEGYPDLKANTTYQELQATLNKLEDEIQMARRYYNGTVRELNVMVESLPSNIVASGCGFSRAEYFELDDANDRAVPDIKLTR